MNRSALILPLLMALAPARAQQVFTNQIATSGLPSAQGNVAAIYDHDNDGLLDLVWASGNPVQRSLMRNNGDLTFTDISAVSGFTDPSGSINPVDIDNNGWTDIICMDWAANTITLWLNNGGYFATQLIQLQVDLHHGFSLIDLDLDGAVDILSSVASGAQIHLMVGHNDVCVMGPEASFQNWTTIAGPFQVPQGAVMIPSILDHDNDGDLDLLVVHETNGAPFLAYHYQPLVLFRNDGGIFTNITAASGLGMGHRNGPTFWDYNNDGYLDVLFGDDDCCDQPRMNRVYQNNGNGTFTDLGGSLGLRSGNTYYFPPEIVDLENDGDEDVVWDIWSDSYNLQAYINTGGTFGTDQASSYGLNLSNENPFAFDADNDGDMDLICGSHGGNPDPARLMVNPLRQNNITSTNYLNIVLKGCASGRSGINSLVRVYRQEAVLAKQTHGLQHNYDESAPDHLHFGLGSATQADSVLVHWPSGAVTRNYNVPANQLLVIEETPGCVFENCIPQPTAPSVALKVALEGAMRTGNPLMGDELRTAGLLPLQEPYTALGYFHIGDGGNEETTPAVLAITGPDAIVDWVVVELRDPDYNGFRVSSRSALLQRDGDVVDMDGVSPVAFDVAPGNYYLSVKHRNHLGVLSALPIAFGNGTVAMDFTLASTAAFGSNARKTVGGKLCLWAGDASFNGQVKYTGSANDRDPVLTTVGSTTPNNTVNGYSTRDVNMNGQVKYTGSANDRDPILLNVGSTTPNATRNGQVP